MVELATAVDIPEMAELLFELYDNELTSGPELRPTTEEVYRLLLTLIEAGVLVVKRGEGGIDGIAGGSASGNAWCPSKRILSELIWYVRPEKRGSGIGSELLDVYTSVGDHFDAVTMVVGANAKVNEDALTRRGYRKLETTYIKINGTQETND